MRGAKSPMRPLEMGHERHAPCAFVDVIAKGGVIPFVEELTHP